MGPNHSKTVTSISSSPSSVFTTFPSTTVVQTPTSSGVRNITSIGSGPRSITTIGKQIPGTMTHIRLNRNYDPREDYEDDLEDRLEEERERLEEEFEDKFDRFSGQDVISTGSETTFIQEPASGDIISTSGNIITSFNGNIISSSGTGLPRITTIPRTGSWSCNESGCHMMTPEEMAATELGVQVKIDAANAKVQQKLEETKARVAEKMERKKAKIAAKMEYSRNKIQAKLAGIQEKLDSKFVLLI